MTGLRVLSSLAAAQPGAVLTRAPELAQFVEATYPPEEAAAGCGAEVLLDVTVDASGPCASPPMAFAPAQMG